MKQTEQQTFEKVYQMPLGKVYPLLVNKAIKKGRTQEEVNEIICWLTGYSSQQLDHYLRRLLPQCPSSQPQPQTDKRQYLRHPCGRNRRTVDAGNTLPGQAGRRTGERKTHGENPENMNRQTPDMPTASRYFPSTSIVCICLLVVPNRLP